MTGPPDDGTDNVSQTLATPHKGVVRCVRPWSLA